MNTQGHQSTISLSIMLPRLHIINNIFDVVSIMRFINTRKMEAT